jgi:hypothetical protein
MRARRPASAAPCIAATAEALPFDDAGGDLVMGVYTDFHWSDRARGVAEMAFRHFGTPPRSSRSSGPVVDGSRAWMRKSSRLDCDSSPLICETGPGTAASLAPLTARKTNAEQPRSTRSRPRSPPRALAATAITASGDRSTSEVRCHSATRRVVAACRLTLGSGVKTIGVCCRPSEKIAPRQLAEPSRSPRGRRDRQRGDSRIRRVRSSGLPSRVATGRGAKF